MVRHVDRSLRMGPSALGMDGCHVTIIRGVQFKCPGETQVGQVQTVDARLSCVLRSVSVTGEASGFSEMRFRALEHAQSQICHPEIVGGSTSAARSRHRISGVSVKSPFLKCSLPRYEAFPRLLACSPVQSFTGSESVPGSRPSGPTGFEGRRNVPRDCRCGARISSLDSGNEFDEPRCQPVGDCARPTSELYGLEGIGIVRFIPAHASMMAARWEDRNAYNGPRQAARQACPGVPVITWLDWQHPANYRSRVTHARASPRS